MTVIPVINVDTNDICSGLRETIHNKLEEPRNMRRCVLMIVCVALLLDNMIYMVIVPIIPVYLRDIHAWSNPEGTHPYHPDESVTVPYGNETRKFTFGELSHLAQHNHSFRDDFHRLFPLVTYHGNKNEDASIGLLFASKAIVQLLINPISGAMIDRYGYERPMLFGLSILFASTSLFAMGTSYGVLFFARSLQGVGSAFADTSGLAMIADRYSEENGRQTAMAIAIAFISFGSLFAPPFGGLLYKVAGKSLPFVILALIALLDGVLLFFVMKPVRKERDALQACGEQPKGTPIYRLIMDPYIALCAGALVMANTSLAFLEPTIAIWMKETMAADEWEIGVVWLPAFFPHVLGVFVTVKLCKMYPSKQWLMTAIGLALEGLGCLIAPFCHTYGAVMVPLLIICFGIALVDTAVLPTLGYLVDMRHTSVYGSVYAIADISYSLAYAVGPIVAGGLVAAVGFLWLNVALFVSNVAYSPLLMLLRNVYKYRNFDEEEEEDYKREGGMEEKWLVDGATKNKSYMLNNLNGGLNNTSLGGNSQKGPGENGHIMNGKSVNPFYATEHEPETISYKRQSLDSEQE